MQPTRLVPVLLVPPVLVMALLACRAPQTESRIAGEEPSEPGPRRIEFLSDPYTIDQTYASMHGPWQNHKVSFPNATHGELLWLTAIHNQALRTADEMPLSQEFLCHSNLGFAGDAGQLSRHNPVFAATANLEPRVFTLIQGQNSIELPPGFAFPILSDEPLEFVSMIVNNNQVEELPLELTVKTTLEYLRDAELAEPPKPLFRRRIFSFVGVEGQAPGSEHSHHMTATEAGEVAESAPASEVLGVDAEGRQYTFHWMVPPGRHVYRSRIGRQLRLPFDTTAHMVTAHLHPYGESLALLDLTTGETLVELEAKPYPDRIGIADMEHYSSSTGIRLYRDHEYELVAVYDNSTSQEQDAMAIMYLYFLDHEFTRRGGEI